MGLELVALVLEIEDEFNISLPDEDMEKVLTPNELAEYIFMKFKTSKSKNCSSQEAFYRLQKLFIENFGNTKAELRPKANLQTLLGDDIHTKWKKLDDLLEGKIYNKFLDLKKQEDRIFYSITTFLFIAMYFTSQIFLESMLITFIILPISYILLMKYFGTQLPQRYEYFSSLVRYVDTNRLDPYDSKEQVLVKVLSLSAEVLNIPISEIHPDAHYVRDLGAG